MSDLDEVLAALESSAGGHAAVATVVQVRGSAYRREGARLVVPEQGEAAGSISAGCLEAEVVEVARQVVATGRPRLVTFDTSADDETFWGWGLGCRGVIDVLVEPPVQPAEALPALRAARDDDGALALVTAVKEGGVARIVVGDDGIRAGGVGDGPSDAAAADAARRALGERRSRWVSLTPDVEAFVEVLEPSPRLAVCGAGAGAAPVVELGLRLGWETTVIDHRSGLLAVEAFRDCRRLVVTEPKGAGEQLGPDRRTYIVVMTHNFLWDMDYLRAFLPRPFAYMGVVGPGGRLQAVVDELRRDGLECSDETLRHVHGPAGLDIGAEGAEEIALAVLAEMTAVHRGASVRRARRTRSGCA